MHPFFRVGGSICVLIFLGLEPKPQIETRVRRNDIYFVIMGISIVVQLVLHLRIKMYRIQSDEKLRNTKDINVHQKVSFFSSLDQLWPSNFAISTIIFATFVISNYAMNYVNSVKPSEIKKFPNYIMFYYSLATFSVNVFSAAVWYFTRTPLLKKVIFRELKNALNISKF